MLKAHNINGSWVLATNALRGETYYCPVCHEELFVGSMGSKHKSDHFRHHPDSSCSYGASETIDHAEKKFGIYSELQAAPGVSTVEMECRMPDGQRPDVYFEVGGQGVAVEVQHSQISDKELIDRTASYSNKEIASLWMPDNIKRFLNTVEISDRTGLADIPLWMRRIAKLTDDVAYDQYADVGRSASELVSIQLAIKTRRIEKSKGVWVMDYYWPTRPCVLHTGVVRTDRNDSGHKLMLWLPNAVGGDGLVSTRSKKQQLRREVTDASGAVVDCNRAEYTQKRPDYFDQRLSQVPSASLPTRPSAQFWYEPTIEPAIITPEHIELLDSEGAKNEFHEMLRQWWAERNNLSPQQKIAMWGFK